MIHRDHTVGKDVLCVVVWFMETTQLKKTGVNPGILVRGGGGGGFFKKGLGLGGPLRPPEAPEF